jgi:ATP-dependent Clp protease ATP-binding subunit ClpA
MGARPLQRVIDKEIKRPLAKLMLFGELKAGGALTITAKDSQITLVAKPKTVKIPLLTVEKLSDEVQGN